MNMAVGNGVIAAGQDGMCCVMKYNRNKQEEEKNKVTGKEREALKSKVFASKSEYFLMLLLLFCSLLIYCFCRE